MTETRSPGGLTRDEFVKALLAALPAISNISRKVCYDAGCYGYWEDVRQSAVENALRRWQEFDPARSDVSTWVTWIVRSRVQYYARGAYRLEYGILDVAKRNDTHAKDSLFPDFLGESEAAESIVDGYTTDSYNLDEGQLMWLRAAKRMVKTESEMCCLEMMVEAALSSDDDEKSVTCRELADVLGVSAPTAMKVIHSVRGLVGFILREDAKDARFTAFLAGNITR